MDNVVIQVKNTSKSYKLYDHVSDRLREALSIVGKKYHKDFFALKEVSFDVKKGETLGIMGRNGAGKSTILKIITGVQIPTSGSVEVKGKVAALLELGSGFNKEYTGIENIYLNGMLMGYTKEEMNDKLADILKFADIGDFINHQVKTYSSGMFARLAFSVAINVDPDILIVDEALSVGDVSFQVKCYRKFDEFKAKGKTILFVTHNLNSIIRYCDRAVVLDKGRVVEVGESAKMVDVYKRILVNQYHEEDVIIEDTTIEELEAKANDPNKLYKDILPVNPERIEYGNKRVEIIDYGILDSMGKATNVLINHEMYEFILKIKFAEDMVDPIFAFTIKDIANTEITGTNTIMESIETGEFKKNEVIEVRFKQRCNLQNGSYMVSFGCTKYENENLIVFHRLYDIYIFQIISEKVTNGFFDPRTKVKIKRQQGEE